VKARRFIILSIGLILSKKRLTQRGGAVSLSERDWWFLETSLTEAGDAMPAPIGRKLLDLPLCFAARHGFGVARARALDQPPEPPGLGPVTAFHGQDGEVAKGQVAVDALVDAALATARTTPPPGKGGRPPACRAR